MPANIKTAVIIGAGNVAWHLGKELIKKRITILQVVSRTESSAKNLADELGTGYTCSFEKITRDADIYIIAASDDAIGEIINNLKLSDRFVVHTSGSTPISVFEGFVENYGVIYPLQTFTKHRSINFSEIPVFIEANSIEYLQRLSDFSAIFSDNVHEANSAKRAGIHIAAVFACNFTNYMYTIANDLLDAEDIHFKVLHPLILETASKAIAMKPEHAQTGPAVRGNRKLMLKHLEMLENMPDLQKLYAVLSASIQKKLTNAS